MLVLVAQQPPEAEQQLGPHGGRQLVAVAAAHQLEDPAQLDGRVVAKRDGPAETGGEAGIALQQALDGPRVAGQRHDEPLAVVFHAFEQGLDRLGAERVLAALGHQAVGLVDEQDPVQGLVDLLVRLRAGLARVFGHQPGTVGLHEVSLGKNAHGAEDAADDPGHGGLAGTRIAAKHHVQAEGRFGQAGPLALLLDFQEVDQAADLLLDVVQPDQLVQLGQGLVDQLAAWFRRFRGLFGRGQFTLAAHGGDVGVQLAYGLGGALPDRLVPSGAVRHVVVKLRVQKALELQQVPGDLGTPRVFRCGDLAVGLGHQVGHAHHDGLQLADPGAERPDLVEGANQAVPFQRGRLPAHVLPGGPQLEARQLPAPDVLEQYPGELLFGPAPVPVGDGDGDVDFHQQALVEVVHQLDELLRRSLDQLRVLPGALAPAAQVKLAAVGQRDPVLIQQRIGLRFAKPRRKGHLSVSTLGGQ